MRVALIHNPTAGEGVYESEDLLHLFREAGHAVEVFGKKKRPVGHAVEAAADVVVVAGGDGTVAKTAIALADAESRTPLFILPLGTSNNIARSLGISATTPVLIRGLQSARPIRFDIGKVTSPFGEQSFVEAAGLGFIATMLRNENTWRSRLERFVRNLPPSKKSEAQKAALGVARLISRQASRRYELRVDGQDLSGDYLAIEVMNIKVIGPRVVLAPDAEPGDQRFDLILVRPEQRQALAEYAASLSASLRPPVECRRIREAEIAWPAEDGHLDDEPWPTKDDAQSRDRRGAVRVTFRASIELLKADSGFRA